MQSRSSREYCEAFRSRSETRKEYLYKSCIHLISRPRLKFYFSPLLAFTLRVFVSSNVSFFLFFFAKIYRHARDSVYELKKKKKKVGKKVEIFDGNKSPRYFADPEAGNV